LVIVNIDDKMIGMFIDSLDCLINHYHEYNYEMKDIVAMATTAVQLMERRKDAVDNSKEVPDVEDPRDIPRPGTHQVLGKGQVSDK
jgi:hypothetical protein